MEPSDDKIETQLQLAWVWWILLMAALLQVSTVLSSKWGGTLQCNASLKSLRSHASLKSSSQCRSVPGFRDTSFDKLLWYTNPCTRRQKSGCPGLARAKTSDYTIIERTCQVGDHFLDDLSTYIIRQTYKVISKYLPPDWDPLGFLPLNVQTNLQKNEAIATLVLRETLVFFLFYLVYRRVGRFCRWMYGVYLRAERIKVQGREHAFDDTEFDEEGFAMSPFRAARRPFRYIIMLWASTRLLWVVSIMFKLEKLCTPDLIYDIRASSFVITITWFFFRWKRLYVEHLLITKPEIDSQIFAIDKIASLLMYGLAASCVAEVLGMALGSLLAVGGVSGLAVGLAAQEVVGNMFGGASLFLTRPFDIGEKIKAGSVAGRVQDIGFMQTKVQGFDGVPLLVPNKAFTSQVITNFSRANSRVLEATFQLDNRHIFMVNSITEEVTKNLLSHPNIDSSRTSPICYLRTMGDDGPEISVTCVVKASGGAVFYRIQQEILVQTAQIITDILGPDSPFMPLDTSSTQESERRNEERVKRAEEEKLERKLKREKEEKRNRKREDINISFL
uniref:Mechanosensitive ion channel MscS domain-containing protein n=1 Tax=Physcomitrium patens TaxID=3218 RepID=A0A2K1JMP7_PHYPA|nr:hypothetical protein PHYPA_017642 [Physcomitrium patens]